MEGEVTRRKAVLSAALGPVLMAPALSGLIGTAAIGAGPARAAGPLQGPRQPLAQRVRLGGFEVTTLLAGSRLVEAPHKTFGTNVSPEIFARVSAEHFLPVDRARNFFTPVLINTGQERVLFDTGLDPAGILAALAEAGVGPETIDLVVLSHMHGDHIGGLTGPDGPTFANARYATGALEFRHWDKQGNEGFERHLRPLVERLALLDDGDSPAPGITAHLAAGHTPGHMVFSVESAGQRLMLTADTANHYAWSLGQPDWEVRFDADKSAAAATRRRIFGQIADERLPFIGYHMPWPGLGYVARAGEGFRYVPASYQMMLEA